MSIYSAEDFKYDPSVACFPVAICLEAGGPEASSEVHSAVQSQCTFATLGGLDKGGTLVIKPLKQKIQACMCMAWGMCMGHVHVHGHGHRHINVRGMCMACAWHVHGM